MPLHKAHTEPWRVRYVLGISSNRGIVIPRHGSKRLYFKLGSEGCGVSHEIKGEFTTETSTVEIPLKQFTHSCDVATLSTANPDDALHLVENVIRRSHDSKSSLLHLRSFKLMRECTSSCTHLERLDKLSLLRDNLEKAGVSPRLLQWLDNNLEIIRMLEGDPIADARTERLCQTIMDEWINEVIEQIPGSLK